MSQLSDENNMGHNVAFSLVAEPEKKHAQFKTPLCVNGFVLFKIHRIETVN